MRSSRGHTLFLVAMASAPIALVFLLAPSVRRAPTALRTNELSLLTFNLQANARPSPATVRLILEADADVVCLQEVSREWHRLLDRTLREHYPATLYRDSTKNRGFGGLAFFSKYAMKERAYLPPAEGGWFPSWIVEAETPAGAVQILNVHLRPRIADHGGKLVGLFTVGPMQRAEVRAHRASLGGDLPSFVVGDFNCEEEEPCLQYLRSEGYVNALPQFDRMADTWQGRAWGIPISARPDHILAPAEFRCVAARVIREDVSDHDPVYAEFERLTE